MLELPLRSIIPSPTTLPQTRRTSDSSYLRHSFTQQRHVKDLHLLKGQANAGHDIIQRARARWRGRPATGSAWGRPPLAAAGQAIKRGPDPARLPSQLPSRVPAGPAPSPLCKQVHVSGTAKQSVVELTRETHSSQGRRSQLPELPFAAPGRFSDSPLSNVQVDFSEQNLRVITWSRSHVITWSRARNHLVT